MVDKYRWTGWLQTSLILVAYGAWMHNAIQTGIEITEKTASGWNVAGIFILPLGIVQGFYRVIEWMLAT